MTLPRASQFSNLLLKALSEQREGGGQTAPCAGVAGSSFHLDALEASSPDPRTGKESDAQHMATAPVR